MMIAVLLFSAARSDGLITHRVQCLWCLPIKVTIENKRFVVFLNNDNVRLIHSIPRAKSRQSNRLRLQRSSLPVTPDRKTKRPVEHLDQVKLSDIKWYQLNTGNCRAVSSLVAMNSLTLDNLRVHYHFTTRQPNTRPYEVL